MGTRCKRAPVEANDNKSTHELICQFSETKNYSYLRESTVFLYT